MAGILTAVAGLVAVAFVVWHTERRAPDPLATLAVEGGDLVVRPRSPRWLAMAREVRVPLAAVTSATVLPAYARARLGLRVWGYGGLNVALGWFWSPGAGRMYVARRRDHPALDVRLSGGRVRRLLLDVGDAERAAASVSSTGPQAPN